MKVKVEICMGSSCFARGNSHILSTIEEFVEKNNHSDSIVIIGHLCMNNCSRGPVIRINNVDYLNFTAQEILKKLDEVLDI